MENIKLKIQALVMSKQKHNCILCSDALKIAQELKVSPQQVGQVLNELKIKIVQCQLGCF